MDKNIQQPIERFEPYARPSEDGWSHEGKMEAEDGGDWVRYEDHLNDKQDEIGKFVIDVEKLLCQKLGREWSATGISIVSLIDELAALSQQANSAEFDGIKNTSAEDEREAFEEWAKEKFQLLGGKESFPTESTLDYWEGWQARAALSPATSQQKHELSFEEIENAFPEDGAFSCDDGYTKVTAQWLHEFARNIHSLSPAAGQTLDNPDELEPRMVMETIGENIAIYPDSGSLSITAAGQIEALRAERDELARQIGELTHSDSGMRIMRLMMELDALREQVAGQQAIPDGWKWMTHPTWNNGKPIPVRFIQEGDDHYYQPFDTDGTDFQVELMDERWEEVRLSAAPTPENGK